MIHLNVLFLEHINCAMNKYTKAIFRDLITVRIG